MAKDVEARIANLKELDELQVQLSKAIMEANGGAFYTLDFLFLAALNRSRSNISAFLTLLKAENYLGATPFVRMQLDSVLRIYALRLVEDPGDLAQKIFKGEALNKQKDRTGAKLSDAYLCEQVEQHEPWISKVYKSGSGFIHLSEKHIFTLLSGSGDSGKFQLTLGARQPHISDEHKAEAVAAMAHISKLLFDLCEDWLNQKLTHASNPKSSA